MSPELQHLYKELYKTGAYFYRNLKNQGLHLIMIDEPMISLANEFGVPEVQKQLLLHLFERKILQHTLPETELLLHQLPGIQYQGKKPCGNLPEVLLCIRVLQL
jgi:hypothetical protein